jgi:hypothetical protein
MPPRFLSRRFKVLVEGSDFWLETDEGVQKYGFYTTRVVDARDPEEAAKKAVALAWADAPRPARGDLGAAPRIEADEIEEVGWTFRRLSRPDGFALFKDE